MLYIFYVSTTEEISLFLVSRIVRLVLNYSFVFFKDLESFPKGSFVSFTDLETKTHL